MHVLEPKEIANRRARKQKANRNSYRFVLTTVILLIISGLCGIYYLNNKNKPVTSTTTQESNTVQKNEVVAKPTVPKTILKIFTGIQFNDLYRSINYPNTQPFQVPPEITGNPGADARIRSLAEKKGFVMTSIPVMPIEKTREKMLEGYGDDLLQPLALRSWVGLKAAASHDGVKISLASAYRSPKSQRELFTERLYATGITAVQIAAGSGDTAVNATLSLTAVPGYSRHHTGYTVDLYCEDGVVFASSICNKWISKDNYMNAKKFGFIPSYPPGGGEQGPEPEPWEYVWVGTDVLYE